MIWSWTGARPPTGADVYLNASRRARTALGVTFYILPAGQETGLRPTPARGDAERASALQRDLTQDPKTLWERIAELQQQYLTWQRYEALNPEGIFLMTVNAKAVGDDGGASAAQIAQRGLIDVHAGYPVRALISVKLLTPPAAHRRGPVGGRPSRVRRRRRRPVRPLPLIPRLSGAIFGLSGLSVAGAGD